jgi:anti-sigma B factor antagonist
VGAERPDPPIFSLDITSGEDAWTTVSVAGELDLVTVGDFARAVESALATGAVTIDMRELTFMDSSGVRALNTALSQAASQGRRLRVLDGMHPSVVRLLQLTGMLGLLPIEAAS